jgi:branched-chain amino acid transport system substrate-binding protein
VKLQNHAGAAVVAASYLVRPDGSVEHVRLSEPGPLSVIPPELCEIAVGLIRDDLVEARFRWLSPGKQLLAIAISLVGAGAEPRAEVTIREDTELEWGLTAREVDVVTLLAGGLTNQDIADRLWLSPRTVTTHVDRVLAKLGVKSRTAAATKALDEGMTRLPVPGGTDGFEHLALVHASASVPVKRLVPASRRIRLQPLVIGSAVPITGIARADGEEMVRGTELALAEINARGGVCGRRVELATADVDIVSEDSIEKGMLELAGRGVDAITSGYFAWQEVAHEVAAEYGAPYLHAATLDAMVQRVEHDPSRYGRIFQVCPSDINYGPGFVDFLAGLHDRGRWSPPSRKLVVLLGAWKVSNLGLDRAAELAQANGWTLDVVHVGPTTKDWVEAAGQVRSVAPAAVLIGHYFVDGTVATIRALLENMPDTLIYSLYAPSIPEFRQQLGDQANGILWATVTGAYSDPVSKGFAERYRRAYGVFPGRSHAGISYDRTMILADAWSRSASPRDYGKVSQEIRSLVHRGVNGSYYLGAKGQAAVAYPLASADASLAQAHLVYQIQDGKHRILSPDPQADSAFQVPPWFESARV